MWALNVVIPDLVGDPLDVGVKDMRFEVRGSRREARGTRLTPLETCSPNHCLLTSLPLETIGP